MQETVLRFIFKVLCNISHVCNGVTTQYAMLRTFLKIIFYSVDKKNSSPTHQISSSWFYVLSVLFPYQLIRDVTTVNWIKSVRFSTQWLKTKATVIVLHESGNYSAHQSSPRTLDLIFYSFTEVDGRCVNSHGAKTEQNLWVEIQAPNMCF